MICLERKRKNRDPIKTKRRFEAKLDRKGRRAEAPVLTVQAANNSIPEPSRMLLSMQDIQQIDPSSKTMSGVFGEVRRATLVNRFVAAAQQASRKVPTHVALKFIRANDDEKMPRFCTR